MATAGTDPGFFLGDGTPLINDFNLVSCPFCLLFLLQNTTCFRKPQVISVGGGVRTPSTPPQDPPLHYFGTPTRVAMTSKLKVKTGNRKIILP